MTRVVLAAVLGLACVADTPSADDNHLREEFRRRVSAYVDLHRSVEGPLPPEEITTDPAHPLIVRKALAREIRKARMDAQQGDIFTPPIAALFTRLVRDGIAGMDPAQLLADPEGEPVSRRTPPRAHVNASYPDGLSLAPMPPRVLQLLPPLPPELRYQFVGRDLALWDSHPHLIVDYIPDVLPAGILPDPTP
jgi:hypothetical protein